MTRQIEIVEVGPRDGLQNEAALLGVEDKLEFIARLERAGARRIEAVSFVNPRLVPQMAGAEEVMAALPPQPGRSRIGLVLNRKGWGRAVAAGVDEANVSLSASEGFARANTGMGVRQQLEMLAEVCTAAAALGPAAPKLSATLSVVWGDPFDGEVPARQVVEIVRECATLGVPEIALADTLGVADPWAVRQRVEAARAVAPGAVLRLHFHDTRRTALANAYAGVEAGVTVLDASCGGIGGCPFAPNATGNVASEDLVYMLDRAGFETGYDLGALVETARWVAGKLGKPAASALSRAGGFPVPRSAAAP
jgi:hydroxymethylglutaryl-CoA lyase